MTRPPRRRRVLTEREEQILFHTANGKTGAETAELVGLSPHSVADSLRSLRSLLRAVNTPHLMALAVARGYLTHNDVEDLDDKWKRERDAQR